ncbi:Hypothetical_protein [Hexamita inflata]
MSNQSYQPTFNFVTSEFGTRAKRNGIQQDTQIWTLQVALPNYLRHFGLSRLISRISFPPETTSIYSFRLHFESNYDSQIQTCRTNKTLPKTYQNKNSSSRIVSLDSFQTVQASPALAPTELSSDVIFVTSQGFAYQQKHTMLLNFERFCEQILLNLFYRCSTKQLLGRLYEYITKQRFNYTTCWYNCSGTG